MDTTDKKKEQIKALMKKMKQEGKPIDWATVVLCGTTVRPAVNGRTLPFIPFHSNVPKKEYSVGERSHTDQVHILREANTERPASDTKDDCLTHMLGI